MDQLIVVLIFGAIGIINYLVRQSAKPTGRPGTGTRPANPQSAQQPRSQTPGGQPGDDERLRKFMEALGVPAAAAPPRKITRPQQPYTPRVQAPVKRQVSRPAPRQVVVQETTPPDVAQSAYQAETVSMQQPSATPSSAAVVSAIPVGSVATSTANDLKSLLRSPSSIRAAIVLKEILGTPKGLQSADVIPGFR